MTIDKIRHYLDNNIYNHWVGVSNSDTIENSEKVSILNNAKNLIESEINNGLLVGMQYKAEFELLKYLTSCN